MPKLSRLSLLITAALYVYIIFNLCDWKQYDIMGWDTTGYYMYLPGAIIYNDLGKADFFNKMTFEYNLNNRMHDYGLYKQPTGYKLNKYAIGTSVMELPFFLIAHWYCLIFKTSPPDGYSQPYTVSVIFAGVVWALVGFFFLRKFLLKYYSDKIVTLLIVLLAFGTNLYFYTVFVPGMSHQFSFALFAMLLYATDKWYETFKGSYAAMLGITLGLIVICRPTNVVVAMLPLLWLYASGKPFKAQLSTFTQHYGKVLLALICFILVILIQCGYWKYVTGHWIHFSYEEEGFNFSHPHLWDGLFSYKKGWFVYTPLAFFAVLGLIPLYLKNKRLSLLFAAYIFINLWIVFSWHEWWYGGSFGMRALIETLPVCAIPLGAFIQWVLGRKKIVFKIAMLTAFSACIFLNLFQSYQLKKNILDWGSMNRAFYWHMFLKLKVTEEDRKLMQQG
jgi:hypothetical protein